MYVFNFIVFQLLIAIANFNKTMFYVDMLKFWPIAN